MQHSANHPAISAPYAMEKYADAREAERAALIGLLKLHPGMVVADVQAAGGFLSDGIHEALDGTVSCLCIEPVTALRQRIAPYHQALADPVESFSSIADAQVDAVVGLAGLHHSESHRATLAESFRILKSPGQLVFCDVMQDSPVAAWLNEFVHRYNPDGHQGRFVAPEKIAELLRGVGFQNVTEQIKDVPWRFADLAAAIDFFRGLFALRATDEQIAAGIQHHLGGGRANGWFTVPWELLYFTGRKG